MPRNHVSALIAASVRPHRRGSPVMVFVASLAATPHSAAADEPPRADPDVARAITSITSSPSMRDVPDTFPRTMPRPRRREVLCAALPEIVPPTTRDIELVLLRTEGAIGMADAGPADATTPPWSERGLCLVRAARAALDRPAPVMRFVELLVAQALRTEPAPLVVAPPWVTATEPDRRTQLRAIIDGIERDHATATHREWRVAPHSTPEERYTAYLSGADLDVAFPHAERASWPAPVRAWVTWARASAAEDEMPDGMPTPERFARVDPEGTWMLVAEREATWPFMANVPLPSAPVVPAELEAQVTAALPRAAEAMSRACNPEYERGGNDSELSARCVRVWAPLRRLAPAEAHALGRVLAAPYPGTEYQFHGIAMSMIGDANRTRAATRDRVGDAILFRYTVRALSRLLAREVDHVEVGSGVETVSMLMQAVAPHLREEFSADTTPFAQLVTATSWFRAHDGETPEQVADAIDDELAAAVATHEVFELRVDALRAAIERGTTRFDLRAALRGLRATPDLTRYERDLLNRLPAIRTRRR